MDLLVSNNTNDPTLTTQDDLPTTEDLTLSTKDTLPSYETELWDNTTDSEISDQEFVDAQNLAGMKSKIKV